MSFTLKASALLVAMAVSGGAFAAQTGGFATTNGGNVSGALERSASTMEGMIAAIAEAKKAAKPLILTYTGNERAQINQIIKDHTKDASGKCPKPHWSDPYRAVEIKEFTYGLTIIGAPGSAANFGFPIIKSSNVIIKNMTIGALGGASNDADMIRIDSSQNVWIDHNELFAVNNECAGSPDGDLTFESAIDIKKTAQDITVSYNIIRDSKKVGLDGSSASDIGGGRKITFHHNIYRNVNGRLPLQRGGWVHAYNNLYDGITGSGINVRTGGMALIEKNWFENSLNPVTCRYDTKNCGKWDLRGNNTTSAADNATYNITWDDAGPGGINATDWKSTGVFNLTLPYSYETAAPACVKKSLSSYAGPQNGVMPAATTDCGVPPPASSSASSANSSADAHSSSSQSSSASKSSSSSASSAALETGWKQIAKDGEGFVIPADGTGKAGYGSLVGGKPSIVITKEVGVGKKISCTATQFGDSKKKVSNAICFYEVKGIVVPPASSSSSSSVCPACGTCNGVAAADPKGGCGSSSSAAKSSSSSVASSASSDLKAKWTGPYNEAVAGALIANTSIDFGGKAIGLGCKGGSETQPAVLTLVNATIKNVRIAKGGGSDGIHCGFDAVGADGKKEVVQGGTCTLENVIWEEVCEDAASIGNGQVGTTMVVKGGSAAEAKDKVFQNNGKNTLIKVSDFTTNGTIGKLGRSCGDCTGNVGGRFFEFTNITMNKAPSGGAVVQINDGIQGTNEPSDKATVRGIKIAGYKAGSPKICVVSKGGYKLRDAAGKVIKTVNPGKGSESTDPRICDVSGVSGL